MAEQPSADAPDRHQLFGAAFHSADWTLEQLWISYLALGGSLVVFDLDAYLAGLMTMPPDQQDVLACVLNERLADLHHDARIPYLLVPPSWPHENALTELLEQLPDRDISD